VLGVQRISASLLPAFAECLGELSGTVTVPVGDGSSLRPGSLHLGNAGIDADFTLRSEPFRLDIEARSSGSLSWSTGLSSWMERLSTALGSRLSVCILSGSEPISHDALNGLMINGSRLIIPSTPTIVCKRMIQGVERYARENSIVFTGASYENLKEVWAENASHE
jgi:hypothetical protein